MEVTRKSLGNQRKITGGGRGGVWAVADEAMNSLLPFRNQAHFRGHKTGQQVGGARGCNLGELQDEIVLRVHLVVVITQNHKSQHPVAYRLPSTTAHRGGRVCKPCTPSFSTPPLPFPHFSSPPLPYAFLLNPSPPSLTPQGTAPSAMVPMGRTWEIRVPPGTIIRVKDAEEGGGLAELLLPSPHCPSLPSPPFSSPPSPCLLSPPGQGAMRDGANGEDMEIRVPLGTIIRVKDAEEGEAPLAELLQPGQRALLLVGGRGGRGNLSFKTGKNTAPAFAERGEGGQEIYVDLELKVIWDDLG